MLFHCMCSMTRAASYCRGSSCVDFGASPWPGRVTAILVARTDIGVLHSLAMANNRSSVQLDFQWSCIVSFPYKIDTLTYTTYKLPYAGSFWTMAALVRWSI